ncbi:MAG TPA: tetratricopeptide repeat protein, partial [Nannocystis exedens]|nr:tetratricopeptide repeat protein [Nannocystis exedens]
ATQDPEAAVELLLRLASVQRIRLDDEEAALTSLLAVLKLSPGHDSAMESLREAYILGERWDELIALYEDQDRLDAVVELLYVAVGTLEVESQLVLLRRIVSLCRERLGQPERGLRALERIMLLQPDNQEVARELLPIYREQGNWEQLIATYEILLEAADNDDDRLELIAGIRDVALHNVGSASQALQWAARAYAIRPSDEILRSGFESAAERANEWDELLIRFESRIADPDCDNVERLELLDTLAKIASDKLQNDESAARYLRKVVDIDAKNGPALATLERIYTAAERWEELVFILQKRLDITPEPERRELLAKIAVLQRDKVQDLDGAVATYEALHGMDPENVEILDNLAQLHRDRSAWSDLADCLQRRLELMDGSPEQVDVLYELSQIQAIHLRESKAAVTGFMTILDLDPDHLPTIDALENLRRSDTSVSLMVMRGLLPYYRSIGDSYREAQALEVIIAAEPDVNSQRTQLRDLATIYDQMGEERKADALRVRLQLVALEPPAKAV